jgi:peptidyl-prolyl cis-trans isomerase D
VEVTDRKFINNEEGVQLATISKPIFPSEETRNAIYDEAMAILTNAKSLDDLSKLAKKKKLTLETAPSVAENDYMLGALSGAQQSRDIIKWAFEANPGDVSGVIYVFSDPVENYENQYVIAGLKNIQPEGIPSVADIKSEIEPLVMNRKKGELIRKKLQGKTLTQAAQVYNTPVDTALGVNFNMNFIPEIGSEPKFLGVVCNLSQGKVSNPIVGVGGVYVAQVSKKNVAPPSANLIEARKMAMSFARGQVGGTLMESIRNNAKIKDYRSKFF